MPPIRNQLFTFFIISGLKILLSPTAPAFIKTKVKWHGNSPLNLATSLHFGNSSASGPSMKSLPILFPPNSNQFMLFVTFRYSSFCSAYDLNSSDWVMSCCCSWSYCWAWAVAESPDQSPGWAEFRFSLCPIKWIFYLSGSDLWSFVLASVKWFGVMPIPEFIFYPGFFISSYADGTPEFERSFKFWEENALLKLLLPTNCFPSFPLPF